MHHIIVRRFVTLLAILLIAAIVAFGLAMS